MWCIISLHAHLLYIITAKCHQNIVSNYSYYRHDLKSDGIYIHLSYKKYIYGWYSNKKTIKFMKYLSKMYSSLNKIQLKFKLSCFSKQMIYEGRFGQTQSNTSESEYEWIMTKHYSVRVSHRLTIFLFPLQLKFF